MSSAVIDLLAQQSAARLRAMQDSVRDEIERLRVEQQQIGEALAQKGGQKGQKAPKAKPERKQAERNGSMPPQRLDSGPPGEKREVFREILSSQSRRSQTVAEILAALERRQIESNPAAVRAMLRRMYKAGEVKRVDHKHWKLASTNGSHQESFMEATSSGPGGMGG
jgi:hypothetical protein